MKSLRELYAEFNIASQINSDTAAIKRSSIFKRTPPLDLAAKQEKTKIFKSIICPQCLKSIVISKLNFSCPFCDKHYLANEEVSVEGKGLFGIIGSALGESFGVFLNEKALFEACVGCHSEIKYLSCPHCQAKIDLFAPYDHEGLRRKRYE